MIGTPKEIEKKALLQESLNALKSNVEACGSLESLRDRYPKGYKKLIQLISKDEEELRAEILRGYKYDNELLSQDIFQELWGDRMKQIRVACNVKYSADAVENIYAEFLNMCVTEWAGLFYLVPEQ